MELKCEKANQSFGESRILSYLNGEHVEMQGGGYDSPHKRMTSYRRDNFELGDF